MKSMNDDLIVRIIVRLSGFISIWATINGFAQREDNPGQGTCTGIFFDHERIMYPQISHENLPKVSSL